jgi:hypothetical protein
VVLTFRSGVSEKGRGYWKINNSVIQEYDYKQLINKVIDKYLIQYQYILQTSINLLVFIIDFKLFTDCLQTLPVRKLLRSMSCIISLKSPPTTRIPVPCSLQKLLTFLKNMFLKVLVTDNSLHGVGKTKY